MNSSRLEHSEDRRPNLRARICCHFKHAYLLAGLMACGARSDPSVLVETRRVPERNARADTAFTPEAPNSPDGLGTSEPSDTADAHQEEPTEATDDSLDDVGNDPTAEPPSDTGSPTEDSTSDVVDDPTSHTANLEPCVAQGWTLEPQATVLSLLVDASSNVHGHASSDAEWTPIMQTLEAFLASEAHSGSSASLTLFPRIADDAMAISCDAQSYSSPDVESVALPSSDFSRALTAAGELMWADEVPTPAAVRGAVTALEADGNDGNAALILVSAGLFRGCDEGAIAEEQLTDLPIYVVGVGDWPADTHDAPWGFAHWGDASGRATAHVTTDPVELRVALERFWLSAAQCRLQVPPAVVTTEDFMLEVWGERAQLELAYDATCNDAKAWRFAPDDPEFIELCSDACRDAAATVPADAHTFVLNRVCPPP